MLQKLHFSDKMPRGFGRIAYGLCAIAVLLCGSPALSAPGIIIGDSIGVGVSMASGLPRLAHNSVSIRSADAIQQVRRTPRDAVAFLSLGTNDAVGSIGGVTSGIDRIVAAAHAANVKLVWIGPPCVLKPWNSNVVKLDAVLQHQLAGRVPYVSIADQQVCDKSMRASDGVHFTMRGYEMLWGRARAAAGISIDAKAAAINATPKDRSKNHEALRKHPRKPVLPAEEAQKVKALGIESRRSAGLLND